MCIRDSIYFNRTNKDVEKLSGGKYKTASKEKSQANPINAVLHKKVSWENFFNIDREWKVETYLSYPLTVGIARSTDHYDRSMLKQVFEQNHLNAALFEIIVFFSLIGLSFGSNIDLFNIPAGPYSVTVTDDMGCEAIAQFDLNRPSDIETNLVIDFEADCENGIPSQITTVEVSGGVPSHTIVWSGGLISGDNGETMTTSQNGTYVIDITDSLGCTEQLIFDVNLAEIGSPGFTYDSNSLNLCDSIGVNDIVQFTNTSSGDYINLIWNFGDGTPLVEGVEAPEHIYLSLIHI